MSAKRDVIKALVRRRNFLMGRLQIEEYSGRSYDLAECNALDYVLHYLGQSKQDIEMGVENETHCI